MSREELGSLVPRGRAGGTVPGTTSGTCSPTTAAVEHVVALDEPTAPVDLPPPGPSWPRRLWDSTGWVGAAALGVGVLLGAAGTLMWVQERDEAQAAAAARAERSVVDLELVGLATLDPTQVEVVLQNGAPHPVTVLDAEATLMGAREARSSGEVTVPAGDQGRVELAVQPDCTGAAYVGEVRLHLTVRTAGGQTRELPVEVPPWVLGTFWYDPGCLPADLPLSVAYDRLVPLEDQQVRLVISVRNGGGEPLEVTAVSMPWGGAGSMDQPVVLPPRGAAPVEVVVPLPCHVRDGYEGMEGAVDLGVRTPGSAGLAATQQSFWTQLGIAYQRDMIDAVLEGCATRPGSQ